MNIHNQTDSEAISSHLGPFTEDILVGKNKTIRPVINKTIVKEIYIDDTFFCVMI